MNTVNISQPSPFDPRPASDSTSLSQSPAFPSPAGPQVSSQPTPFNSPAANKPAYADAPVTQPATSAPGQAAAPAGAAVQQRIQELDKLPAPPAPQTSLSNWIRRALKDKYGQEIDPDKTDLVSLNYNTGGRPGSGPYPGKVVRTESLTVATMKNSQAPDTGDAGNTVVPYRSGGPDIQLAPQLPIKLPNQISDLVNYQVHGHDERADYTYTYEGIYPQNTPPRYDHSTQLPIDPADFRSIVWNADPSKVVDAELDAFWNEHAANYAQQARVSFFGAASSSIPAAPVPEAKPGDLMPQDEPLASQLLKPSPAPGVECGQLSIHGYEATDVLYARDKTTGRILLYTPGNDRPLHGFDSTDALNAWLANEMKDPATRTAFAAHFCAHDRRDDGIIGYSGVDSALMGIAKYPEHYAPAGRKWHGGQWDPNQLIGLAPKNGDPFASLAERVKDRSYQDASAQVTSDKDVIEKNILRYTSIISTVLSAAMIPLSTLSAGARVVTSLLSAGDLTSGGASVVIGLDEKNRNKPGSTDDVINGVMQTAMVGVPKIQKKAPPANVSDSTSAAGTPKDSPTVNMPKPPEPSGTPAPYANGGTSTPPSMPGAPVPDGMETVTVSGDPTTYFAYRTIDPARPRELYTLDKDGHPTGTGKFVDADGERVQTTGGGPTNYLKTFRMDNAGKTLAKDATKFSYFSQDYYKQETTQQGRPLGMCQGFTLEAMRRIDRSSRADASIDLYQAVKDMARDAKRAASKEDTEGRINSFQNNPKNLDTNAYESHQVDLSRTAEGRPLGDALKQGLEDLRDGDVAIVGLNVISNGERYAGHSLVIQRIGAEYELFDPNNGVFKYPSDATLLGTLNRYGETAFVDRKMRVAPDAIVYYVRKN